MLDADDLPVLGNNMPTIITKPSPWFGVKIFTYLLIIIAASPAGLSWAAEDRELPIDQIIQQAQRQFSGRVINLQHSPPSSPRPYYRIRLMQNNANVIIIHADKRTGHMSQQNDKHKKARTD